MLFNTGHFCTLSAHYKPKLHDMGPKCEKKMNQAKGRQGKKKKHAMIIICTYNEVIRKVTLSSPCLWASFHPLSLLPMVSTK